ncbi:RCC1 domain-containing protein 1 isoform X11 [Myotis daubentonii]|uniref:RCC1 domain-containing protein 1 isoform X11 n=1 Tax=Myotis daubentonii TaxID=98922 RepID=UPI002872AC81|nr:RCC1 domain-containing protein 1 isoform X11 [Myotis daubentonii]
MAAVQLCGQEGGALPVLQVQPRAVREVPVPSPAQPAGGRQRAPEAMAEERPGSWFGFGFCGFGQALGSGRGRQVLSPEPLCVPDAGTDICDVSAAWSYTAFVSRAGRVLLSGSAGGAADGCRDAWASESLLVVLRDGRGAGVGAELQAWAPGSALRGEPLWAQTVAPGAGREDGAGAGTRAGPLPLLPCARAYVSPRPPLYRPLAPELRARRLELGAEHALLLDEAGQVYSWGGGRDGGHLHLGLERVGPAGPARQGAGGGRRDSRGGRASQAADQDCGRDPGAQAGLGAAAAPADQGQMLSPGSRCRCWFGVWNPPALVSLGPQRTRTPASLSEVSLRRSPRIKQLALGRTKSGPFYSASHPQPRSVQRVHSSQQSRSGNVPAPRPRWLGGEYFWEKQGET